MLSYQHAYHAGNSSDVLKHLILFLTIKSLLKKESSFHFYDTHAGTGLYDLESPESKKTNEAKSGIEKLKLAKNLNPKELPGEVLEWLETLEKIQNKQQIYPGSPHWVRHLMRANDRLTLFELHPAEFLKLKNWKGLENRIHIHQKNSFKELKGYFPPKESRAVCLIDPSYELISDYQDVVTLLREAYQRLSNGIYLIWYPVVSKGHDLQLIKEIEKMQLPKTLWVQLSLKEDLSQLGINATGMIIINCPWQMDQKLKNSLPWLSKVLHQAHSEDFIMKWLSPS